MFTGTSCVKPRLHAANLCVSNHLPVLPSSSLRQRYTVMLAQENGGSTEVKRKATHQGERSRRHSASLSQLCLVRLLQECEQQTPLSPLRSHGNYLRKPRPEPTDTHQKVTQEIGFGEWILSWAAF